MSYDRSEALARLNDLGVEVAGDCTDTEVQQLLIRTLSAIVRDQGDPVEEGVQLAWEAFNMPRVEALDGPTLYERIVSILKEMPAIGKGEQAPGSMGGYRFRGIEQITAALKPLLAKHGVFAVPSVIQRIESPRATGGNKTQWVVDLLLRCEFYDESGDMFASEMWGQGSDMGDKATQKAVTAAWKSMLGIVFCVSDAAFDAEAHEVEETTGYYQDEPSTPEPDPDPLLSTLEVSAIQLRIEAMGESTREALSEAWRTMMIPPLRQLKASNAAQIETLLGIYEKSEREGLAAPNVEAPPCEDDAEPMVKPRAAKAADVEGTEASEALSLAAVEALGAQVVAENPAVAHDFDPKVDCTRTDGNGRCPHTRKCTNESACLRGEF